MSATGAQFDRAAIDAIVREVLRRVTSMNRPTPSVASPLIATHSKTTAEPDNTSYKCEARVIALGTLRGKLDHIKTLRVKPKTIVTPAVRDELRDRKIEIVFDLGSDESAASQKTILLGTTCKSTGTRLRDQLAGDGTQVQLLTNNCVNLLAKTIGEKISTSMRALIVTDKPYTAICVANRNNKVQAAIVRDQREAIATKQELNPNCIVLSNDTAKRLNLTTVLKQLNW